MKLPQPSEDPDDAFKNRRILAYYCAVFAVFWFMQLIWMDAFVRFDTAKVLAYLGVPAALLALPVFRYLRDVSKQENKRNAKRLQP